MFLDLDAPWSKIGYYIRVRSESCSHCSCTLDKELSERYILRCLSKRNVKICRSEEQVPWSWCALKQVWLLDQWQARLMFTLFLYTWARTFGSIHLEMSQYEECENLSVGTTDCLILMRLEASLVTRSGAGRTHVHIALAHLTKTFGRIHHEKSQW